jgi:hypothetical protein
MTPDERLALQRLADVPRGITKSLMLAHGFPDALIAALVLNGLVTVEHDVARIGQETIEVDLVIITDVVARRSSVDRLAQCVPPRPRPLSPRRSASAGRVSIVGWKRIIDDTIMLLRRVDKNRGGRHGAVID